MNKKSIRQLEKRRLKLYKKMIELDRKMETCKIKELCSVQFEFGVKYRRLQAVERIIKTRCPIIKDQLNSKEQINYRQLIKTK